MDKKRREKNNKNRVGENMPYNCSLFSVLQLVKENKKCGILSRKFRFLEEIGHGYFAYHKFDGLYVGIFDSQLKQNVIIKGQHTTEVLELSFLLEGEQIISLNNYETDLVFESLESYIVYLTKTIGEIKYNKQKRIKEVRIRMDTSFINRHYLNEVHDLSKKYTLENIKRNFAIPLCLNKQKIITEILTNTQTGLLKRLFLEAKVLELIALQFNTEQTKKPFPNDNLVKKIYQAQFIISSNISKQYSILQLAKQVGVNDYLLKKEFKRVFNQTIFEYATSCRMEAAKKLLLDSKIPIYEIAELVGFKNSTHFSAAFKKNEATTPNKFRKKNDGVSREE
mgnify:CR=1 FL=1